MNECDPMNAEIVTTATMQALLLGSGRVKPREHTVTANGYS